ncbi:hypothetical protein [Haloplanus salinarum]|uniref:hypothetical protein n=1 Tax=Haloplanus salinarum TaxID=1912324 RepID=UPI00214C5543|nr:hypothetical protein [Haloplanus salinarum]
MIRSHLRHLRHALDERSITIRAAVTFSALLSLPVFGSGVRTLGQSLGLGRLVLPLLVLAHVPAVVAIIAVWSIGCDVCRGESA